MNDGWIKLHRSVLSNEVYRNDPTAWRVFEYILLSCDRKTGTYRSGRFKDSEFLGMKATTFYQALKRLQNHYQMVDLVTGKVTIKFTDVTIRNWHKFQSNDNLDDNPTTIK